ncbi:MAG: hypothetical protein LBR72_06920, partial [Oscillospiraceae bacterium]|nr:hypothetical protein [Oscillospiraceae bacterium]
MGPLAVIKTLALVLLCLLHGCAASSPPSLEPPAPPTVPSPQSSPAPPSSPVPEPTPDPSPSPSPEPVTITLQFAGDIILHSSPIRGAKTG